MNTNSLPIALIKSGITENKYLSRVCLQFNYKERRWKLTEHALDLNCMQTTNSYTPVVFVSSIQT